MVTYNDEVACRTPSNLKLTGAIQSTAILALLRKMDEEELDITQEGNELIISGSRRKAGLTFENEIELPIESIEAPGEWVAISEEWLDAVALCVPCCSKDEQFFNFTCVHITPKYIEACDNFQVTRVRIKTGLTSDIMVKRDAIKCITSLGMTQVSDTAHWVHFKNPTGLVVSCRKYAESYNDLAPILAFEGHPIKLPKGLAKAAEKASIFTDENSEDRDKLVTVSVKEGKLKIAGKGPSGWFREIKKVDYTGPDLTFKIAPEMLIEISKKDTSAEISPTKLRISGAKWEYVSCLFVSEK